MCTPTQKKLCGKKICKVCYPRSLDAAMITKNIKPSKFIKCIIDDTFNTLTITSGSNKKCLFRCKDCDHIYESDVYHFIKNKGCYYCSTTSSIICGDINCNICYPKSFHKWLIDNKYTDDMFIECLDDKSLTTLNLTKSSHKMCLLKCKMCKHPYKSNLNTRDVHIVL